MLILKQSHQKNSSEIIAASLLCLEKGGVIALPTDTIYGLAADYFNSEAKEKIFLIKKRPQDKILPVFVDSIENASEIVLINDLQKKFLKKVWPGKVTCILKKKNGGEEGLRIPKSDFLLELLKKISRPLWQTSANISGNLPFKNAVEVYKEFENAEYKPDIIIDLNGEFDNSERLPSTVLDLTKWPPKVIREGAFSAQELQKTLNML
uniref:L-threonylcarbamoyladenylate synthase n=1 Tax=Candidatus Giovannonibacteria bacterium GW2011_GWF2_42_19 TaxID=1618659 RepID=A0A0G0ZIU1_9BACT|nr:MAG: Sua5/YciO/YrdC/YwlC family protein [Candidatus Giovannonibacteria bacterium GW2011_GWF2_42_19]